MGNPELPGHVIEALVAAKKAALECDAADLGDHKYSAAEMTRLERAVTAQVHTEYLALSAVRAWLKAK
jgi:hypothetical protein